MVGYSYIKKDFPMEIENYRELLIVYVGIRLFLKETKMVSNK
jgi:hypothetical protein